MLQCLLMVLQGPEAYLLEETLASYCALSLYDRIVHDPIRCSSLQANTVP